MRRAALVLAVLVAATAQAQKSDGPAATPPMGWNSWNHFGCDVGHGTWTSWGVLRILDKQLGLREYAGPGHWNDPDMLEVGNGMTMGEDRAHFSMWAMLAAPLLAGNDLRNMSEETRQILTNAEVIAVDQDPLGVQGLRALAEGELEIWFKPLAGGDWAMCVLNRSELPATVEVNWSEHHIADGLSDRRTAFDTTSYRIRDLWTGRDLGTTGETLIAGVAGHDVLMVRLVRQPDAAERS